MDNNTHNSDVRAESSVGSAQSSVESDSSRSTTSRRTQNSTSNLSAQKRHLYSERINNIYHNIREGLQDPAYSGKIIEMMRPLKFTLKDLAKMEACGTDIICDDANFYNLEEVTVVPEEVSPTCKDSFQPKLRVGDKTCPDIRLRTLVVPGNRNMKYKSLFYVKDVGYENDHMESSHLKHYTEAVIVDNKLNTQNLVGLEHYNNNNIEGPSVIISPFSAHVLLSKFPAIEQTGLPVLALLRDFRDGLHIGSQQAYYKDREGNVIGVSRGSNYFWRDHANPFKHSGNFGSYKYETLCVYGDQRLVYFQPGLRPFELPYTPKLMDTWHSAEKVGMKMHRDGPILQPAPEPRVTLGVCDMIPAQRAGPSVMVTNANSYPTLGTPPWYARLGRRIHTCELLAAASTLSLYLSKKYLSGKARTAGIVCSDIGFVSSLSQYCYLKWTHRSIRVSYNLEPLYFKGKHAEGLKAFYAENPVDPDTGLPWGCYWVDNYTICQVSQKGLCNYTNVHKLIIAYCMKVGASKTAAPGIYLDAFPTTAPKIVRESDNTFHTAKLSPLPRVTSATTYSIHLKPHQNEYGVHLLNPEKYRQFIASAITEEVVAATASNRVVVETIKPRLSRKEFYARYCNFWRSHNLPFDFYYDMIPNLDNYRGPKLKRYLAVLKYYGIRKVICAYDTFMKREALPLSSFLKKAVRLICPNNSLFLVATKNFFSEAEKLLLTALGPFDINLFAKHRTIHQRWLDILKLRQHYRYCYSGDAKNFDATHRNDSYLAEVDTWERLGLEHDLAELMRRGKTYGVIHHQIPMRHSGDLCTGSGNCFTIAACSSTLPPDITIYNDGDDTLFFSNSDDVTDIITNHFRDSGFVMELDDPVDMWSEDWEVEFCHVFYCQQGYSYDCERLLNRFGNIVGCNNMQIAKTILGKIQALPILEAAGCDFGFSVRELVRGDPDNVRDRYTMSQFEGMQNYLPTRTQDIDLNDPDSGFVAKVLLHMRSKQYYLRLLSDRRWKSVIIRDIARMLDEQQQTQTFDTSAFSQAEKIISAAGLRALTPLLSAVIRNRAVEAYDLEVVRFRCAPLPQIPNSSMIANINALLSPNDRTCNIVINSTNQYK